MICENLPAANGDNSPDVSINLVSNSIPIVAGREVDIGAEGETRRWTREVLPTPLLKEEERGGERIKVVMGKDCGDFRRI